MKQNLILLLCVAGLLATLSYVTRTMIESDATIVAPLIWGYVLGY